MASHAAYFRELDAQEKRDLEARKARERWAREHPWLRLLFPSFLGLLLIGGVVLLVTHACSWQQPPVWKLPYTPLAPSSQGPAEVPR